MVFFKLLRQRLSSFLARQSSVPSISNKLAFQEYNSKHRTFYTLYDLMPISLLESYVSPNATVAGEVLIGHNTSVWSNVVIRGDINAVRIGSRTSIGDHSVIHTAGSLPNGIQASVIIGDNVNIQSGCTLYSCHIENDCLIGHRSIVLEGARIEAGSVIGPNSVVPPGRIIPTHQLWAGNPVEYIRDLTKPELTQLLFDAKVQTEISGEYFDEYLPYRSAYLKKTNSTDDLEPQDGYRDTYYDHEFGEKQKALNSIYN